MIEHQLAATNLIAMSCDPPVYSAVYKDSKALYPVDAAGNDPNSFEELYVALV